MKFFISKKKNLPIVILMYHRVTEDLDYAINRSLAVNHPLDNFIKEMKFIKKRFNIVPLDKAVDILKKGKKPGKPTLAITFDDGFVDNYRLACPVLKKLSIPATIFLTAGLVGTNNLPWVEKIGQTILQTKEKQLQLNSRFNNALFNLESIDDKRKAFGCIAAKLKEVDYLERNRQIEEIIQKLGASGNGNLRMLNWQEVKEMSKNNITFGAHTLTHSILSKMPSELAKKEIRESKLIIENKLGLAVKHFAFPNGRYQDFTEDLKQYCKEIGFESISTAVYGNNKSGSDVYALKRLSPGKTVPIFAVDLMRSFLGS